MVRFFYISVIQLLSPSDFRRIKGLRVEIGLGQHFLGGMRFQDQLNILTEEHVLATT